MCVSVGGASVVYGLCVGRCVWLAWETAAFIYGVGLRDIVSYVSVSGRGDSGSYISVRPGRQRLLYKCQAGATAALI